MYKTWITNTTFKTYSENFQHVNKQTIVLLLLYSFISIRVPIRINWLPWRTFAFFRSFVSWNRKRQSNLFDFEICIKRISKSNSSIDHKTLWVGSCLRRIILTGMHGHRMGRDEDRRAGIGRTSSCKCLFRYLQMARRFSSGHSRREISTSHRVVCNEKGIWDFFPLTVWIFQKKHNIKQNIQLFYAWTYIKILMHHKYKYLDDVWLTFFK